MTTSSDTFTIRLAAIFATVFSSFLAVGLVLPLAPVTLVDRLGESKSMVGYSLFGLAFGGLIGRFVGGAFVDARGPRVGFTIGLSIAILGAACYSFTVSTPSFLIGRFILGVGESTVYIAAATTLINLVPETKRSRYLGLLGSAVWGGISLGPAIGESLNRIEPAGLLTIGVLVCGLLLVSMVFRDLSVERKSLGVTIPRRALMPGLVVGLYNLGFAAVTGFVILHLRDEGIDPRYSLTIYGLSVLFGRIGLGGIPDRIGPLPSIVAGISCMMVGLSIVAIAPSRALVWAALCLFGVGYSMPFPALASLTVNRIPPTERASGLAVLGGMYDVFVGIAGLLFGVLADSRFGTTAVFLTAIASSGAALVVSFRVAGKSAGTLLT